jgi:hypothetical protein
MSSCLQPPRRESERGKAKEKQKAKQKEKRAIIRSFIVDEGMHAPSSEESSDSELDYSDKPRRELGPFGFGIGLFRQAKTRTGPTGTIGRSKFE